MAAKILELYYDAEVVIYEEINVPSDIEILVCDHVCKKLVLPNGLRVIDLNFEENVTTSINIPNTIQYIKMENVHIVDKCFEDLFPENAYFSYTDCTLDGIPINVLVVENYMKYFTTILPELGGNTITHRHHREIIEILRNRV